MRKALTSNRGTKSPATSLHRYLMRPLAIVALLYLAAWLLTATWGVRQVEQHVVFEIHSVGGLPEDLRLERYPWDESLPQVPSYTFRGHTPYPFVIEAHYLARWGILRGYGRGVVYLWVPGKTVELETLERVVM